MKVLTIQSAPSVLSIKGPLKKPSKEPILSEGECL